MKVKHHSSVHSSRGPTLHILTFIPFRRLAHETFFTNTYLHTSRVNTRRLLEIVYFYTRNIRCNHVVRKDHG